MKKNKLLTVLLCILVSFAIIFVINNRHTDELSTEKSVYEYLQKKYPEEDFAVQFYRDVTLKSSTGCSDEVPGHTWDVTSKSTGISFYVQDDYNFNVLTCDYSLTDDYFDVYLSNKIKEINDYRVIPDNIVHENDIDDETGFGFLDSIHGIDLDLNNFTSERELADVAVSVREILLKDERLKSELQARYFWFNIYRGDTIISSIDFQNADNANYIIEKMNEQKE